MRYAVIIPAAGSGSRMGASVPKVLLPSSQHEGADSILRQTVQLFCSHQMCEHIVVCVPEEWRSQCVTDLDGCRNCTLVAGGATRQDSVSRGIEALYNLPSSRPEMPVLVHDAARCCITLDVVQRVIDGVAQHRAVTAAVPIVDSLCRAGDGAITQYVDRSSLWAVQTPQGFLLRDLREAHIRASQQGVDALDDASLVAEICPVHIVEGDRLNIKVTQPGDLRIANLVASARSK